MNKDLIESVFSDDPVMLMALQEKEQTRLLRELVTQQSQILYVKGKPGERGPKGEPGKEGRDGDKGLDGKDAKEVDEVAIALFVIKYLVDSGWLSKE